jgi:hypothetical protein
MVRTAVHLIELEVITIRLVVLLELNRAPPYVSCEPAIAHESSHNTKHYCAGCNTRRKYRRQRRVMASPIVSAKDRRCCVNIEDAKLGRVLDALIR